MQNAHATRLSRRWLVLGVTALAVAGLYALLLVVARAPALSSMPLLKTLFGEALVVHVDLSVLAWFLCAGCLLWSMAVQHARPPIPYLEEAAQLCFALGMLAMTAAPLDPRGEALMSNYIPMISSPVFSFGLALLFCGTLLMLLRLFTAPRASAFDADIQIILQSAGWIALAAAAAFVWSSIGLCPARGQLTGAQYYEVLYWGGGHVLQFTHTQLLLAAWLLLARALAPDWRMRPRRLTFIIALGVAVPLVSPLAYLLYDVNSVPFRSFFTHLMIAGNGLAPVLLAFSVIPLAWRQRAQRKQSSRALWSALVMSLSLFFYGGFLGELIVGQNVVIPAHYHGSIVGVTLGFMGAAYLLLPRLGYRDASGWKLAYWQPYVYGGGQLLHISGLAWSGGYGVLRKTPGGLEALPLNVKAAMGVMGLGGVIAIAGGLMFVIVMVKAMRRSDAAA